MSLLFVVAAELLFLFQTVQAFDNVVSPNCETTDKICHFDFSVKLGIYPQMNSEQNRNETGLHAQDNYIGEERGPMYTINGLFLGPTITVYEGQEVAVKITNRLLQEGLTIHWHGIKQLNSYWMDGVPGLTQCSIAPGQTFTYRFIADPMGTKFYYSNLGTQRAHGMSGALIVLPRPGSVENTDTIQLPQKNDFVLMVQDWLPMTSATLLSNLYSPVAMNREISSDESIQMNSMLYFSAFINGKGIPLNQPTTMLPLEYFHAEQGGTYKYRIINNGVNFNFMISIDEHPFTLVAVDGNDVTPTDLDRVIIGPGERYDVVIKADKLEKSYWIRAEILQSNQNNGSSFAQSVLAVLHYGSIDNLPDTQPSICTEEKPCKYVNCPLRNYLPDQHIECIPISELKSSRDVSVASAPEETVDLFFNFRIQRADNGKLIATINNIQNVLSTFRVNPDGVGVFDEECPNSGCTRDNMCSCTHRVIIPTGKTVRMVLYNSDTKGGNFPIHLHGHTFQVVKVGYPEYDSSGRIQAKNIQLVIPSDRIFEDLNEENPPQKDTVLIPPGGYVVVKFTSDNPGFWLLDSQITAHSLAGMSLIIHEGNVSEMTSPPEGFPTCGTFDITHDEFREQLNSGPPLMPYDKHPTTLLWVLGIVGLVVLSNILVAVVTWFIFKHKSKSKRKKYNKSRTVRFDPDLGSTSSSEKEEKSPLITEKTAAFVRGFAANQPHAAYDTLG